MKTLLFTQFLVVWLLIYILVAAISALGLGTGAWYVSFLWALAVFAALLRVNNPRPRT